MTDAANSHWEWMISRSGDRLHYMVDESAQSHYDDTGEAQWGVAVCGRAGWWSIPGFFSRLGCPRCAHCCRTLGIPRGDGTPANEAAR